MIYLDHNATTPVDPEVRETVLDALSRGFGNPSSSHAEGRRARGIIENARHRAAELIGCEPGEIYFTSGGTESNNLAILGTASAYGKGHIIASAIEHPSVTNPLKHLESKGFSVTFIGVDESCRTRVEEIRRAIRNDTILVAMMHSNNETGVLQPVDEAASAAKERGVRFHVDAAQSVGKVPVKVDNVDMMSIASHKFYGPKGIGAIYVRKGTTLHPVLYGAGHEGGMRPGTENTPGIAGMGMACELAARDLRARTRHIMRLSKQLLRELQTHVKGARLNGHPELRLPGTLNVLFPGADSAALVDALSNTVAISAGSACHAGVCKPSAVLKAMGLGDHEATASLRISIGKDNTEKEISSAARMLSDAFFQQVRER
jgi:cysteine desulfurase